MRMRWGVWWELHCWGLRMGRLWRRRLGDDNGSDGMGWDGGDDAG